MKHLALVLSAILLPALGASAPARAADDNDIIIGFAVAQSGWMSENDGPPLQGAELAIKDINAKGGVLGRPLKAVFADTKSDQTEGAKAGLSVLAQGAKFMVVSCDYDMGAGAATVGNDAKIPTMSLCASDAKMGVQGIGPYAFTMANTSLSFGASLAQWATQVKKWKTAYLLLDTRSEYPKGICAGFKEQWQKGGTVAGEDTFKQDDPSIASQITRMQQVAAKTPIDFVMICSYSAGNVSAIKQLRAAGMTMAIGGGDSMDGDYWTSAIPHLDNHYAITVGSTFGDDPRPAINDFMNRMTQFTGSRPRFAEALNGYSVIQAMAIATQKAGTTDGGKVLGELNKFTDTPLIIGPTTFTADLHIALTRPLTVLAIRDGKGHFQDSVKLQDPPPLQLIFKQ